MGYLRIRSRHQPFEVAALAMAGVCGVLLLLLGSRPTSVRMAMPVPIQIGWEIGLVLVGVGGLLGILWPGRLATGLGIELASVVVFGTISGMYTMALVVVSGRRPARPAACSAGRVGHRRGVVHHGARRRVAVAGRSDRRRPAPAGPGQSVCGCRTGRRRCHVISTPAPEAPPWLQVALSVFGILGGSTGLAAIATVVVQRGKFKADAADTLTEAALTLVQPLQTRITELEEEALSARSELGVLREQVNQLQFVVRVLTRTLDRWRAAIRSPDATLRKVRAVVAESERLPEDR
ncbi:hypothetical protein [Micromonospora cremea]|uniref:Uncharacterized protein n=1 Tax=Micromonospora cremea TaxID=709881 RepID=A0A1N6B6S4_9ACTN|nr:hypothetical protein [Micromonospora cremea]SIN41885.1 hypothetical protein SAMN04489832_6791 [Micromonospora cremea]